MSSKNYMLLKASLTDGHYTTEDFLMVGCIDVLVPTPAVTSSNLPTPTPSATASNQNTVTPTPTPSTDPGAQIVLNASNNWTYRNNDFLIIRYVPASENNSAITLRVPVLPAILLPQPGQPAPIPSSASLLKDNNRLGDLIFINTYVGQNIVLLLNDTNYTSTINIGQIIF